MMTAMTDEDDLFAVIIKRSLALLVVLTCVGFVFYSTNTARGILAGGLLSIMNFAWIRNVLQRILGLLPSKPSQYALMRFIIRMSVTGLFLYLILTSGWFSLAGLLIGLSIIVVNIVTLSIYRALSTGG